MGNLEYEISRLRKLTQKPIAKKFTEQTLLYLIEQQEQEKEQEKGVSSDN